MDKLAHALTLWLKEGKSQKDFTDLTGIDQSTTNRLFNGERGLSITTRARIYHAFAGKPGLEEALGWIVADLRDNLPPELERYITIRLADNATYLCEPRGQPRSKKARAKAEFIGLLESDDTAALDLVLSLYDWKHGKTPP